MISATRLFVGNLPGNTETKELHSAFSVFGEITNLDLKSKPGDGNESKKFAFVSVSADNVNIESCIKHFSNVDFNGNRLYVTRARESFLERLQRERELAQIKVTEKNKEKIPRKTPILKLSDKLNPRKRRIEQNHSNDHNHKARKHFGEDNIDGNSNFKNHGEKKHSSSHDHKARKRYGEDNIDGNSNFKNHDEQKHSSDHDHKARKHFGEDKIDGNPNFIHHDQTHNTKTPENNKQNSKVITNDYAGNATNSKNLSVVTEEDKKKHEAEQKRLESMKKKRQEFKEKKMIIKSSLTGVDKVQNKKIKFSDAEDGFTKITNDNNKRKGQNRNSLFDDQADESDDELNFEVKKQYEGRKGQQVLDLQSRYKSDKRFTLDERFIEDDDGEEETGQHNNNEEVELGTPDEKAKQMNILQDVLGVTIKQRFTENDSKKSKPKLGMLRYDPLQPDHAKFLTKVETKPEPTKKSKKKAKENLEDVKEVQPEPEGPKVEVSKEQFYKVSDALKEAIAQPSTFSLRSLFGNKENDDNGPQEQETDYIPLEAPKAKKVKNPLDLKEKNPFVYDSSDSETEETDLQEVKTEQKPIPAAETKAVWKENLFFSKADSRLKEGLAFFSKAPETGIQKERRELKSLMNKRIYNKDRKNQMFKKKIGGKKKSMKKPYKNKS